MSVADLGAEAVQQQVQDADRGLDVLVGLVLGQPAERSAAGAPGKISTLHRETGPLNKRKSQRMRADRFSAGLTVCRMRM